MVNFIVKVGLHEMIVAPGLEPQRRQKTFFFCSIEICGKMGSVLANIGKSHGDGSFMLLPKDCNEVCMGR